MATILQVVPQSSIDFSQTTMDRLSPNQNVRTSNYVTGVSGWTINGDGTVEFASGYFRGDITGATGTFSGTVTIGSLNIPDLITANSFHVNTSGDAWWGATTIGSAVAKVLKTGAATFTNVTITGVQAGSSIDGQYLTVTSVTVDKMNVSTLSAITANLGTITAGTITSGTIQTASSGARVVLDSTGIKSYDATTQRAQILNDGSGWFGASDKFYWNTVGIVAIDGSVLLTNSIGIGALNLANRGWTQTCVFLVTDADTIAWATGTFTTADGTVYNITGNNTANMAAKTYIYLDIAVSTTAYQITTTATTSVGAGKVLIAIAQNGTTEATYQVMQGQGGQNIDAANIVAGSITANEIAASTITSGKLSVTTLSSITADLGNITAGTIVLPSGGLIRSGQTAYNTGTGFYIGNDSSVPKFSIGDGTTNNSMTWDGVNLSVNGRTISAGAIALVAAETITAGQAVREDKYSSFADANTQGTDLGTATSGYKKIALPIFGNGVSFSTLKTSLRKVATPTDNVTFRIETSSSGLPSGTLANANATATIDGSTLTTSYVEKTITFAGAFTLTDKTQYWLVISRDGASSDTNYYRLGRGQDALEGQTSSGIGSWAVAAGGSIWGHTGNIHEIQSCDGIYSTLAALTGTTVGGGSSNSVFTFLGFANNTATIGSLVDVTLSGSDSHQSGLIPGLEYFVSDVTAAGALTTLQSASCYTPVGIAINQTTISINKGGRVYKNFTDVANARIFTGFYPRFVQCAKSTYSQSELLGETLISAKDSTGFILNTGGATTYFVAFE